MRRGAARLVPRAGDRYAVGRARCGRGGREMLGVWAGSREQHGGGNCWAPGGCGEAEETGRLDGRLEGRRVSGGRGGMLGAEAKTARSGVRRRAREGG